MISLCCYLCGTDGTSLSTRMKEILEKHNQRFTHLWEGFLGSKQTCRLEPFSRLKQCCAARNLWSNCVCYIATRLIVYSPLPQIWTQPVWDGAAAVHMQRILLPGDGALHGKHSTCYTSSTQSVRYRIPIHLILPPLFLRAFFIWVNVCF